jgi:hypothetical protein
MSRAAPVVALHLVSGAGQSFSTSNHSSSSETGAQAEPLAETPQANDHEDVRASRKTRPVEVSLGGVAYQALLLDIMFIIGAAEKRGGICATAGVP